MPRKQFRLTVFVDEGVVLHGPEVVDVLPGRRDHPLTAVLEQVVQQQEGLVRAAPIGPD